jgi:DUF1680 family protein
LLFDERLTCARKDFALRIKPFSHAQVRLLPSAFMTAQNANRELPNGYDADRLLRTFRINAGLPSSAKPFGGCETADCEPRGHFVGHYLSGCALMYPSTCNEQLRNKAEYMVAEPGNARTVWATGTSARSRYRSSIG